LQQLTQRRAQAKTITEESTNEGDLYE
jgi:hypothetical protein